MPNPSFTQTLDDPTIATAESYIDSRMMPVTAEHTLLLGPMLNMGKMPGVNHEHPVISGITKASIKSVPGREIYQPVATGDSTNHMAFRQADLLDVNIDDVGTAQRLGYAYYTDFAGISLQEALENQGPEARLNILQERIDQALRTTTTSIEADLWSTNADTSDSQKEVVGLGTLVPLDPTTGTVWNIDRSTYTWQRSNQLAAGDTFANVGLAKLRRMRTTAGGTSGVDLPTANYTTSILWEAYAAVMESNLQLQVARRGDLGFDMLTYQGTPVFYSSNCITGYWYMLNHRYMRIFKQPGADFKKQRYDSPPNQAMAALWRIFVALQWGFSRFDRQGVVTGFTDT